LTDTLASYNIMSRAAVQFVFDQFWAIFFQKKSKNQDITFSNILKISTLQILSQNLYV
jgi:hypothetical protein